MISNTEPKAWATKYFILLESSFPCLLTTRSPKKEIRFSSNPTHALMRWVDLKVSKKLNKYNGKAIKSRGFKLVI